MRTIKLAILITTLFYLQGEVEVVYESNELTEQIRVYDYDEPK